MVPLSKATTRAEALTDGAFAIIMTLLVIELHPVDVNEFRHVSDQLLAYWISFIFLGTYWIAHYNLFHWIKGVNHVMLWMNIWFLSLVSLVPFFAGLLITNEGSPMSLKLYACHVLLILASLGAMSIYAVRNDMLSGDAQTHIERVIYALSIPSTVSLLTLILS